MNRVSTYLSNMSLKVPNIKLNNGVEIPVFGLGTWQGSVENGADVRQAIKDAINIGYRHIDCAHLYNNEDVIGDAIAEKIADGTVKRKDLFIVTKLWNTHHRPGAVEPMLRSQLNKLRLDCVDLYLMHWPFGFKEGDDLYPADPVTSKMIFSDVDYIDTWLAMEELQKKGLTRSLGISNFNSRQIERLLEKATIVPVTNQVECHAYLNQKKLRKFCAERGIVLTSFSPLGAPERPQQKPGDLNVLYEPKLKIIAEKFGKTPAQILLRYNVQLGNIVIPKSANKARLEQNINIFDFELSQDDMDFLDTFDCNGRILKVERCSEHLLYPFSQNIEF